MEQVFATANKLSEVIRNMRKCFECTICLHTISEPVKTRCGHRFCRECIQTLLQNTNATCPLCNSVLHRRSISKDEHMKMYIDSLEKLIEAIRTDSGIDISLNISGPRSACESNSSGPARQPRQDRGLPGPSSDVNRPSVRRRSGSNSNSKSQRSKATSRKSKGKMESSKGSSITNYLKKFTISCAESVPPDEPLDEPVACQDDSAKRVQSWLEALPKDDDLDDPDKVPVLPEGNLDDTVIYSASQNRENKIDKVAADDAVAVKLEQLLGDDDDSARGSARRRLSKESIELRLSKGGGESSKGTGSSRGEHQNRVNQVDRDDQKPSTSGVSRLRDDKEKLTEGNARNQEKLNDIQRTPPSDMLPAMNQNWSSVVQFGKEMRTRKKKLRSLNVSVENKNKGSRNESVKEIASSSRTIKDTRRRRKGTGANTSESVDDKHLEKLPNMKSAQAVEQRLLKARSPKNSCDRSMSDAVEPAGESSFIMLEEGEQVHIRNLNSYQMKDIIGVSDCEDRGGAEIENLGDNGAAERSALSPEKCRGLSKIQDRSESPLQATPGKRTIEGSPVEANDTVPVPGGRRASLTEVEKTGATEKPTFRFQSVISQTPVRNRLSLRRKSTDRKSNESPAVDDVSRLLSVRRDLNRQMDQSEEGGNGGGTATLAGSETNGRPEENGGEENRDVGGAAEAKGPSSSSGSAGKRRRREEQDRQLVRFRKLGKVAKRRRKPVTFVYLGSTDRRVARSRNYFSTELAKTCNPVELVKCVQEAGTRERNFGGIANDDDGEVEQIKESKLREEASDQPEPATNEATKRVNMHGESTSKQTPPATKVVASEPEELDDVLVVSLYDDEQEVPRVERECGKQSSVAENTKSKDTTVRMLSPKKDSQLKFLSLYSPTTNTVEASKIVQQSETAEDNGARRSNFSDIRGAHSRALMRKSQPASEASDPGPSSAPKKRKRSGSREKVPRVPKRKSKDKENSMEDDVSDSNSQSSKSTYIINAGMNAGGAAVIARKDDGTSKRCQSVASAPAGKDTEPVIISSDSDVGANCVGVLSTGKRVYRKVVPLISSGTDSSDVTDTNGPATDRTLASPTSKRKRTVSSDSDESAVNCIVENWSKDLNSTDRSTKKGKVERPRVFGAEGRNDAAKLRESNSFTDSNVLGRASLRRNLSELGVAARSERPSSLIAKRQETLSGDVFDDDSPDFGATIDRIRSLQKTLSSNEASNKKDSSKQTTVNYCLMQDNFDDIFANFDTQLLDKDAHTKKSETELSRIEKPSEPRRLASDPQLLTEDIATRQSNSSDKENRCKVPETIYEFESDDDKTLTEVDLDSKGKDDKLLERLRPAESTSNEPKKIVIPDAAKLKHDACEHDSLMDITQHSLLIKQFEQDLFGKPFASTRAQKERLAMEERTPEKSTNVRGSRLKEKDAEHSGEEDDIVENTPEIKTRSVQSSSVTVRSSVSSPVSSVHSKQATPSTAGRSSSSSVTPIHKRIPHPLYQSTPKARALASSNYVASTGEKKLDLASANESAEKQKGARSATSSNRRLCFVCTGLVPSQIEDVKKLALRVNGRYVTNFDREVTHVIVTVNADNGANKTLKYLQGVAYRKWIVSYQWVISCLAQKRLVNEEPYEAVDCGTREAGPRNSRLRQKGLFEGFVFLCLGPYVNVSVAQYEELLRATGATVVDSLEALAAEKKRIRIIVIQAEVYADEIIIEWYKKTRAVPILYEWVVECISQYRLISFYRYLQELSRQDVRKLGYPEFLFEEDADEDSDSACNVST